MKVKTLEQKKMKVNPSIQHQHHISSYNHIYRLNITQYAACYVYTFGCYQSSLPSPSPLRFLTIHSSTALGKDGR